MSEVDKIRSELILAREQAAAVRRSLDSREIMTQAEAKLYSRMLSQENLAINYLATLEDIPRFLEQAQAVTTALTALLLKELYPSLDKDKVIN